MERRRSSIRRLTEAEILDCQAKGTKCGEDFPEDKDDVPICRERGAMVLGSSRHSQALRLR